MATTKREQDFDRVARMHRLTPCLALWCHRHRAVWLLQLLYAGFFLVAQPVARADTLYMDATNPTGLPAINQSMPAIAAHMGGICAAAAAADVMWEWSDVAPYNTAVPTLVSHPASVNPPEAWPGTFGNWNADAQALRTTLETLIYGPGQNNGYGEAGGMTKYLKNTGFDHINGFQDFLGVSGRTDGLSVHSYNGANATYQNLFNSVVSTDGNGNNALLFANSIANVSWHNPDGTFVNNMGSKSRHALTLTGVDVPNASRNDPGNSFLYFSNGWSNFSMNPNPVSTTYYDQYTNLTIDNSANNNPDNKLRINANAANNPGGRGNSNNYLVRGIANSNVSDYVQMYQYVSVVRGGSPYVLLSVNPATPALNKFTYTVANPDSKPMEHYFLELNPIVLSNLSGLLSSNVLAPLGWGVEVWNPAGAVTTRLSSLNSMGAPGDGVELFAAPIAEPGSNYNPPWQPGWGGLHFYWTGLTGSPIGEGSALDFSFLYDSTAPYSIDGTLLSVVGEEANIAQYFSTVGGPTTVPEPSTWLLLGSGLVGLVLWRRRQRVTAVLADSSPKGQTMIRSLIVSVILLLSASIAHATDITWSAFSSDGLIGEQAVTLPNGFFLVETIAHLPPIFMDPGNTYPVTGEVRADKCGSITPGICGPNNGSVAIDGITYNFVDAVHNVSWDFFFAGAVSVPSQLSDPFATLTGPATLTGTYTIFDHGIALQNFTVDAVNGTLSMLVTRDLMGHYERHLEGTIAAAYFPVPEPATWLLLGSGLAGMILWRKRTA